MIMILGMFLLPLVAQDPPIRHVPRTVDSTFAERSGLCPDAPYLGGVSQPNDARRSVAQVLGAVAAVDVYQAEMSPSAGYGCGVESTGLRQRATTERHDGRGPVAADLSPLS
jgi:hypothetical protein